MRKASEKMIGLVMETDVWKLYTCEVYRSLILYKKNPDKISSFQITPSTLALLVEDHA